MIARSTSKTWRYTCTVDVEKKEDGKTPADPRVPKDGATWFECAPLSAAEEDRVASINEKQGGVEASRFILLCGLRGWGNFKDADGAEQEFRTSGSPKRCHPDNLDRLDVATRLELADHIFKSGQITAELGN